MTGQERATGFRVAVIGGGPAGLMAAEVLSGRGLAVDLYERMPSLGRKLLMAGRGGLNLTHSEPMEQLVGRYGSARDRLRPMLEAFDNAALRDWAEGLGEATFVGSSGRVFPQALKASPLLRAWLARLAERGVRVHTRHQWLGFTSDGGLRFAGPYGGTTMVEPAATVLALGGASWPRLGADGGWVALLEQAGVAVAPLLPANAGVDIGWSAGFAERFAGTPLKTVELAMDDVRQRGDLVITAYGLEGGPVYALGPAIRQALGESGEASLRLDLRPDVRTRSLAARVAAAIGKGRSLGRSLRGVGLTPLAVSLLREAVPEPPREAAALAALIRSVPLRVTGQQPLARAISTAGGIELAAVDDSLMLKARPGVFVAGEMLDWEAPTGGYLLQACLATGRHAALGLSAWLERGGRRC